MQGVTQRREFLTAVARPPDTRAAPAPMSGSPGVWSGRQVQKLRPGGGAAVRPIVTRPPVKPNPCS